MSDMHTSTAAMNRRLNHVEFQHRPGEDGLVVEFFDALGCSCFQIESQPFGKYVVVRLDESPHGHNDIFVCEVEPEQLALEEALQREISARDSDFKGAGENFRTLQKKRPYRTTHIGMRIPNVPALDTVLRRLSRLIEGNFSGRLDLGYTITRSVDEAKATSTPVKQIWIWTNVICSGLFTMGQQIELQAYDA